MKRASLKRATSGDRELLVHLGFGEWKPSKFDPDVREFHLNGDGRSFDDVANVYADEGEAQRMLREAYLRMPATQALMQGLHGRGAVPVGGALHLLARHGLIEPDALPKFRSMLAVLNAMGVVSYSNKHQTVRITAPMPSVEDDPQPTVRVVEPDRPYSNVRHLRETLRACRDYIWWADMHFEKRGFEPLADEADAAKVKSIRILSSTRPSLGDVKDYERFKTEMHTLGINVEYRVVPASDREWHDRFIVTRDAAWYAPPLGVVVAKGSYSQFQQTQRPPFETWWKKGTPVEDI